MNSADYQNVLDQDLAPFLCHSSRKHYKFQQDNAAIHVSQSTKDCPDLNPIENLWGCIARAVYAGSKSYTNVASLQQAILKASDEVSPNKTKKLIDSMPSRLFDVIAKQRSPAKY
uniref:Tc1-like transposase DDE domain-containing protein n=1 Tax=Caenorhabditis japonica TaxID=281687 RepID=A0A8R1E3R1_CAEJA